MVYTESDIAKIRSFLGNISDTLMEATWFGCYLISTNVGCASELCLSSGALLIRIQSQENTK